MSAPTKHQIAHGEILFEITGKVDSLGRVDFTAYWLDDYLPPDGVRGQIFFTELDRWIARHERGGQTVRRWNGGQP